jgi:hypothetical protein
MNFLSLSMMLASRNFHKEWMIMEGRLGRNFREKGERNICWKPRERKFKRK